MDDSSLYQQWYFWLVVGGVLVLAAATLLILVIFQARRILKHAVSALNLVTQIKKNTMSIWDLQTTNEVALEILKGSQDIKDHTELVANNLPQNSNMNL